MCRLVRLPLRDHAHDALSSVGARAAHERGRKEREEKGEEGCAEGDREEGVVCTAKGRGGERQDEDRDEEDGREGVGEEEEVDGG